MPINIGQHPDHSIAARLLSPADSGIGREIAARRSISPVSLPGLDLRHSKAGRT